MNRENKFNQACQFVALALSFLAAALAIVFTFFDVKSLCDTIFFIPAIAGLIFLATILLKEAVHLIFQVFGQKVNFMKLCFSLYL
jgi:hypothetical protein